jgi:hypothetical protein
MKKTFQDSNLSNPRQSNGLPPGNESDQNRTHLHQINNNNAPLGSDYHHHHVSHPLPPSDQLMNPDEMFVHPFLDEDEYSEEQFDMILSLDQMHQHPLTEIDYLPPYPSQIQLASPPGVPYTHLEQFHTFPTKEYDLQDLAEFGNELVLVHTAAEEEEIRRNQAEEGKMP